MRKIILVNGLIAGCIVSAMLLLSYPLVRNGTLSSDNSVITGYASMVISLSLIFFGIRTYRDQYKNGSITFGAACKIGMLITLVASIMYAATWQVYSYTVATDFAQFYAEGQINDLKANGATEDQLKTAQADLDKFSTLYENPLFRFLMSIMEILPVGLVISLTAAGILRKRDALPAS